MIKNNHYTLQSLKTKFLNFVHNVTLSERSWMQNGICCMFPLKLQKQTRVRAGRRGWQAVHQEGHSGLFWVLSLQLIFSENKCFNKVLNHPEPPVLGVCAKGHLLQFLQACATNTTGLPKGAEAGTVPSSFGMTPRATFPKASL